MIAERAFTVELHVTAEHVKKSCPRSLKYSAICKALYDAAFDEYSVTTTRVVVKENGELFEARLTGPLKTLNDDYWADRKISPASGMLHFFYLKDIQKSIHLHLDEKSKP